MFGRHRICQNPDCRETFEAKSPLADCCQKNGKNSCKNRLNYLRKLAKKALGNSADRKSIYNYMVLKCLIDKRKRSVKKQELIDQGVDFNAFSLAIPFAKDDTKSVLPLGDLGLLNIDNDNFSIVIRKQK